MTCPNPEGRDAVDATQGLAAVLRSPQACEAVAADDAGTVIRLVRQAWGWSQTELASRSGWSQATISRIERSRSRAARDTAVLLDLATTLDLPTAAVGVATGGGGGAGRYGEDVDRRDFLSNTVGVAAAALLPASVADTDPGRIATADVAQCWTSLRRLFEMDDREGGGTVYRLAENMAGRLTNALAKGSYSPAVCTELRTVCATTMEHAGWLSYDAGRTDQARRWWLETCHLADLAEVSGPRVTALASMALQASSNPGRGRDTVNLAQAARTAAGDTATPTLLSVLAAREALGHATTGDRTAAVAAVADARRWLDHGRSETDPLWVEFWGPADLACHETRVALAAGNAAAAESSARAAVDACDPDAYPRNRMLYEAALGHTLARVGQYDEAIAIAGRAVQQAQQQGSRRVVGDLRRTVHLLGQSAYRPARTFAEASRRLLPA